MVTVCGLAIPRGVAWTRFRPEAGLRAKPNAGLWSSEAVRGEASERQHNYRWPPLDVDASRAPDLHLFLISVLGPAPNSVHTEEITNLNTNLAGRRTGAVRTRLPGRVSVSITRPRHPAASVARNAESRSAAVRVSRWTTRPPEARPGRVYSTTVHAWSEVGGEDPASVVVMRG